MATITNQCDVLLQATTPRMLNVSSNFITVTPTTNAFSTTATSTSPSSIAVRASLSGELRGTVTWSTVPTVAFTVSGNILTLPATSVAAGSSVTVTATLTLYGQTYTSSATISHQADTVTSSLSSSAVTISTNTDGTGGTYTGATSTMTVTIGILDDSANWAYTWTVPAGVTATGQATRTIAVSAMTVDNATLTCTATRAGWATQTKSFTVSKSKNGSIGTNGTRTAILDLYRWSATVPTTFPVGTSTYTWATAQFTSPATLNSWTTTPGASVAGQTLYIARQVYVDSSSTATSTVTWSTTTAISLSSAGTNGANGTRTAFLEVYRWSATVPTTFPAGTSTYTWATGAFTAPGTPNSWSLTPGASTPGYTLYACSVRYADTLSTTTSSVTWNTSTAYVVGFAGATGAPGPAGSSSRVMYARIANNPQPNAATAPVTGDARPSAAASSTAWGTSFNVTWSASDPTPTSNNSLYQSDGIYNGTNTVWSTPYISSLKVGKLESIVSSTGQLTVNSDGHIKGGQTGYDAGTGFFLGFSGGAYKFSIGGQSTSDTASSLTWDGGSNFKLKNAVFQGYSTNTFKIGASQSGNLMSLLASAAPIAVPLVFWNDTSSSSYPFFDVNTNSSDSTTGAAIDFTSSDTAAIALIVTQSGSGGGAAKFFNTPSSKQAWIAPGGYSFYSPSGGGKIYIADGNGPFTGFHDTLSPIDKIIEIGDIMTDTNIICKSGISSTLFETTTSSQENQTTVIGIACAIVPVEEGTPGALWKDTTIETDRGVYNNWSMINDLDPEIISSTYKVVQVNALGEGQINVCGMAGNINAGDYIVTSSIAGKGMRQSDDLVHNYTVAKARESATFDDPTQVKMIACIYLCG